MPDLKSGNPEFKSHYDHWSLFELCASLSLNPRGNQSITYNNYFIFTRAEMQIHFDKYTTPIM